VWVRRKRKRTNINGAANSHICILTQKSVFVGERKRGRERERERERDREREIDLVSLAPHIATCALILMRESVYVEERERERERERKGEKERETWCHWRRK